MIAMMTTVTTPTRTMATTGKECHLHKTTETMMTTMMVTMTVTECTDVLVTDAGEIVTTQTALHQEATEMTMTIASKV